MPIAARRSAPLSSTYHPRRDVLIAVALKALLIAGIYFLLVSPSTPPPADAAATAAAVISR